jgi:hypothetical protein
MKQRKYLFFFDCLFGFANESFIQRTMHSSLGGGGVNMDGGWSDTYPEVPLQLLDLDEGQPSKVYSSYDTSSCLINAMIFL